MDNELRELQREARASNSQESWQKYAIRLERLLGITFSKPAEISKPGFLDELIQKHHQVVYNIVEEEAIRNAERKAQCASIKEKMELIIEKLKPTAKLKSPVFLEVPIPEGKYFKNFTKITNISIEYYLNSNTNIIARADSRIVMKYTYPVLLEDLHTIYTRILAVLDCFIHGPDFLPDKTEPEPF